MISRGYVTVDALTSRVGPPDNQGSLLDGYATQLSMSFRKTLKG